jgi:hypothetical protein
MRGLLVLTLVLLIQVSCGASRTHVPETTGQLVVHVFWQEQGVSGVRVELLGTGKTLITDDGGNVRFDVAPGHYVVRAYDINQGGPCCGHVDLEATIQAGQILRLSVWDCLPCV